MLGQYRKVQWADALQELAITHGRIQTCDLKNGTYFIRNYFKLSSFRAFSRGLVSKA